MRNDLKGLSQTYLNDLEKSLAAKDAYDAVLSSKGIQQKMTGNNLSLSDVRLSRPVYEESAKMIAPMSQAEIMDSIDERPTGPFMQEQDQGSELINIDDMYRKKRLMEILNNNKQVLT